jgi:hypothetical protein
MVIRDSDGRSSTLMRVCFAPKATASTGYVRFTPVSSTGRRNTTRWSAPAVVLEQFLH